LDFGQKKSSPTANVAKQKQKKNEGLPHAPFSVAFHSHHKSQSTKSPEMDHTGRQVHYAPTFPFSSKMFFLSNSFPVVTRQHVNIITSNAKEKSPVKGTFTLFL
jgi:hypothetical protein